MNQDILNDLIKRLKNHSEIVPQLNILNQPL